MGVVKKFGRHHRCLAASISITQVRFGFSSVLPAHHRSSRSPGQIGDNHSSFCHSHRESSYFCFRGGGGGGGVIFGFRIMLDMAVRF